jgi:hypothetical protein
MNRLHATALLLLATFTSSSSLLRAEDKPAVSAASVQIEPVSLGAEVPAAKASIEGKTAWYDSRLLGIEGQAYRDTKAPFDRLPARAEETVRKDVWNLSRHSAGLAVRFVTDATTISCRWTLTSPNLAMPHMPATGVSGVDLYARDDEGKWRWLAAGKPTAQTTSAALAAGIKPGTREYRLYFPLYNGVTSLEIGVPAGSKLSRGPAYATGHEKPIVFYGTSITHGASASRTGMVHTAILGRRLERPVVNLGFSGNGRMEPEVTVFLNEIDAAVYVIDCLPNIQAAEVTARTAPLVRQIREAHPDTPILLVEDRNYSDGFLMTSKRDRNQQSQAALKKEFALLKEAGVKGLYYLVGDHLLGDDNEGTVDSSHPTDLGFFRQADAFEPVLKEILK